MSSQSLTRAADTHVKDQSYYTAFSVARRVAEWLVGDGSNPNPTTANPDTRFDLIKAIDVDNPPKNPAGVFTFPFEEGNLGDGLGRCDITLKYVDSRKKIDITVDATYQDKNTVVTATIKTPSPGIAGMVADGSGVDAPSQVKVGPLTEKEAGLYKIEVWGAAGGNGREKTPAGSAEKQGGRGGYASGEVYLPKDTVLWLNAGGIGQKSVGGATTLTPGGFNGGGSITTPTGKAEGMGASGGGASDVRAIPLGDDPDTNPELTRRIIVAGG
ncbi:MAG: hypothetical protein LBN12_04725, partial [Clostridiales Family XIII bacterium]|nr:hypothetical protein [Clostridiales Family XIII bacterium]